MIPQIQHTNDKIQNEGTWQKNIHEKAYQNGLTIHSWSAFHANEPLLKQELYTLASRASDWAERTGGCNPKPKYCFVGE